jgi:putative multiple sugar transport system substrate-binding protein
MRKSTFRTLAVGVVLALGLAACGGDDAVTEEEDVSADTEAEAEEETEDEEGDDAAAAEGGLIGVAMPTETSERWIADGAAVKEGLEALGYEVSLQYAADDIPTQSQQIDQMITQGVELLIIAAIDGTALSGQLQAAADNGIPVVSYDRLIRDSENVDFYVTFDNYNVGVQQATSLLVGLGLLNEDGSEGPESGPFNVELFAGSLDDNNAFFFWQGAIDTLQPYFDDGTLVVPSDQTDIEQAATLRWSQETAQRRMEDLLTVAYSDGTNLDGVLSPFDGISRGILTALQNAGYGPTLSEGMPAVSGQDAEVASVKLIADDVQFATIFKDTRKLAEQSIIAAQAFLAGEVPEANDTETYDNGVKVVPSFLLESDIVYVGNIEELLVDSGYFTAEQIEAGVIS